MFGLEDQKKKRPSKDILFELESELKDPRKYTEIRKKVEGQIQEVKKILRLGENKKEFDQFGQLLHGYTSFLKVVGRFSPGKPGA